MLPARNPKLMQFAISLLLLAFIAACATVVDPYFEAAAKGDVRTIKSLLESGTSVNKQNENGESALMIAANNNEEILAQYLLRKGAAP